jgi:GntR family transcriptional regulator
LVFDDRLFRPYVEAASASRSRAPLYFQLFSSLKSMILEGVLGYGEQVPTEEQLASLFSVSRITSKRALDELASEGLVERRRGKGTHVIYRYSPQPVQAPLTGMLQEIESMARNSRAVIHSCVMEAPPKVVREAMGLAKGEQVLHLNRVRERQGRRFGHYSSWTAGVAMPDDPDIFITTPRLSFFRANGLELTHVTQILSAKAAGHTVAKALGVEVGAPLLSLTRQSFQNRGSQEVMLDYMEVLYNPEHFQYAMDLTLD